MIQITPQMRILLAVEPVDFRKGIDGLAACCRQALGTDPLAGALIVFRSRSRRALKLLVYDGQGFWLCQKRLSHGRFGWWPETNAGPTFRVDPAQLHLLLWNGDLSRAPAAPLWRPVVPPRCDPIPANSSYVPNRPPYARGPVATTAALPGPGSPSGGRRLHPAAHHGASRLEPPPAFGRTVPRLALGPTQGRVARHGLPQPAPAITPHGVDRVTGQTVFAAQQCGGASGSGAPSAEGERPRPCSLRELGPLEIRQVRRTAQEPLFGQLMQAHHYLRYTQPVGEHLKYLRSNLTQEEPAWLWKLYMLWVEIEGVFRTFKNDLHVRPIYHSLEARVAAHIFVSFLAYGLWVTLKQRLTALAPGLTPRQALDQLAGVQMLDVVLPTTDGRTLVLSRYTQPDAGVRLLLQQLKLALPEQPPPRLSAAHKLDPPPAGCSEDLSGSAPGK